MYMYVRPTCTYMRELKTNEKSQIQIGIESIIHMYIYSRNVYMLPMAVKWSPV